MNHAQSFYFYTRVLNNYHTFRAFFHTDQYNCLLTISILQVHFVTSLIIVFIRGNITLRTLAHVQKFLCHRALVFSTAGSLANIQNKRYSSLGGPVCVVAEPFPEGWCYMRNSNGLNICKVPYSCIDS